MNFRNGRMPFGPALFPQVPRQRVMQVRSGDRGMAGRHCNLMQIGNDIADRVEPRDGGLLMVIDLEAAGLVMRSAERCRELRANFTAENRIKRIEC